MQVTVDLSPEELFNSLNSYQKKIVWLLRNTASSIFDIRQLLFTDDIAIRHYDRLINEKIIISQIVQNKEGYDLTFYCLHDPEFKEYLQGIPVEKSIRSTASYGVCSK